MAIYDPIVDLFSQDEAKAPTVDQNQFYLGGDAGFAQRTRLDLANQGAAAQRERQMADAQFGAQGAQAVTQGNTRADTFGDAGAAGLNAGANRGAQADTAGRAAQLNQTFQSNQLGTQANAAQTRTAPTVNLGAANASAAMGTQSQQALTSNARALGMAAQDNQAQAATARGLGATAGALGSNATALGAAAQANQPQAANAAALGAAGQTGAAQQGNAGALRNFYQQGPGASAAEAQLRMGSEQAMAANLALARSGRGGANAGAERQALFANAAQQGNLNQQMGLLRAQESDAFRNRQLQAMGLETGALGTARGQDIAGLSAQAQALGTARGQDIGALQAQTGALGQQVGALGTQGNVLGQARGQDIGALQAQTGALGQAGSLANQQQQIGAQTALGVSGQQIQQGAQNDALTLGSQNIAAQRQAAGDQAALQAMGLGNQAIGQGQQFAVGMGGLGNQSIATGQQSQAAMGALGNQAAGQGFQTNLAAQGMGLSAEQNQLNANIAYEQLRTGQALQASMANAGFDQARDASIGGMAMGAVGALALSDVRAKEEIDAPGEWGDADDTHSLGGASFGYDPKPYGGMNNPSEGYRDQQAQLAALGAGQNAQAGATAQANAKPEGPSFGQVAGKGLVGAAQGMISPTPNIPIYQQPPPYQGAVPYNVPDITSDERAKKQAVEDGANAAGDAVARWLYGDAPLPRGLVGNVAAAREARYGTRPTDADVAADLETLRITSRREIMGEPSPPIIRPGAAAPRPKPKPEPKLAPGNVRASNDKETDLRNAQNFSYQYKDPNSPGAASGRQVGPMAQDILKTDAAPLVRQQPNGMLGVDGPRAGLVALGAQGEQQRRIDDLERRLAALGVRSAA